MLVGFLQFTNWHLITHRLNIAIPIKLALTSWFYSQLGKYIPGKILMLVYRYTHYSDKSKITLALAFYLEIIFASLAAALWSLCYFYFAPENSVYSKFAMICAPCLFVVGHPKVLNLALKLISKFTKKDIAPIQLNTLQLLQCTFLNLFTWFLLGFAFYFFIQAFYPTPFSTAPIIIGALAAAVILGMLSIFAPAGLGVRESVLIVLLVAVLPKEHAIIIALCSRLWFSLCEILNSLLVFLIQKVSKPNLK